MGEQKQQFPELHRVLAEELMAVQPKLWIGNTSLNAWIYVKSDVRAKGVKIRYRATDHWIELVIPRILCNPDTIQTALDTFPLPGAERDFRGQTEEVVWLPTPELDLTADAESQRAALRSSAAAAADLQQWYEAALHPSLARESTRMSGNSDA